MSKKTSSLRPTTPANSKRYDSGGILGATPVHCMLSPGWQAYSGQPKPLYLPPLWSEMTNPEGKPYFVCCSRTKFVTDQYMYDAQTQRQIMYWVAVIGEILTEKQLLLPPSAEFYLEAGDDECQYYIADHSAKVLAWLDPVSTEDLGLKASVSDGHLKYALEELYWNHVEYFPSHELTGLNLQLDELCGSLIQCRTDQLTSENSTFPFTAQKCDEFLQIVRPCRDMESASLSYTRWSIARIWALVCNHRFLTHYGQQHARLSRDQSIFGISHTQQDWKYTLLSSLLFKIPELYNTSFEKLWADEVVYQYEWRGFIPRCREDWLLSTALSFAVMICDLLLLNTHGSRILSSISTALSAVAVFSGTILLTRHQRSSLWTAPEAADYLFSARNERSGFQQLACQFSLPRGVLLWALGTFSLQIPLLFANVSEYWVLVILASVLLTPIIWLGRLLARRSWDYIQSRRIAQIGALNEDILPF